MLLIVHTRRAIVQSKQTYIVCTTDYVCFFIYKKSTIELAGIGLSQACPNKQQLT